MNKTTEALKLAEEVISKYSLYCECMGNDDAQEALAAIREALAEQTQLQQAKEMLLAVDDVVKQSLSLAVQDDFAASGKLMDHIANGGKVIAEPVKQKPVATKQLPDPYDDRDGVWFDLEGLGRLKALPAGTKLYAAPVSAKREWVELTDDEIYDALAEVRFVRDNLLDGCRAVIAADREKNK
jgi:hypothetical protein